MTLPKAIFVGFFPKITQQTPDWFSNKSVKEICSVSNCISSGPEGWIDQWRHNELGFYDSEALAYKVIGESPEEFDIYAYKFFPLRSADNKIETTALTSKTDDFPDDYEFLGYDIVSKSVADFFECSPLSCNDGAAEYEVNQFCLITNRDRAYRILLEIQEGSYEPGPYYLFEVYRKRHG